MYLYTSIHMHTFIHIHIPGSDSSSIDLKEGNSLNLHVDVSESIEGRRSWEDPQTFQSPLTKGRERDGMYVCMHV